MLRPSTLRLLSPLPLFFSLACSSSSATPLASTDGGPPADSAADGSTPIGGSRPVSVHVPPGYKQGVPAPLVIMLHGYSATSALEEAYLGLTAQSDARGFLYAHPDGTKDTMNNPFWNATDACCDLGHTNVDDSTYLSTLIDQIEARYTVDPKRVFFMGHSNGAFMSYRMACDHADQIAAIVSLAGAMFEDTTKCKPSSPVAILEIHGTADMTIPYAGGSIAGVAFPGATTTVSDWVTFDGCASTADTSSPALDLEGSLAGAETTVTKYAMGCKAGGHAELWTINGGGHIPTLSTSFAPDVIDFLYAHPKP